jgi:acyl carrier protein
MDDSAETKDLTERVLGLVEAQLGKRGISARDRFREDLGAESFDLLNIVAAVEDGLGVFLEEEEIPAIRDSADLLSRVLAKAAADRTAD